MQAQAAAAVKMDITLALEVQELEEMAEHQVQETQGQITRVAAAAAMVILIMEEEQEVWE
jgi:hypothetical protein|tara:strand:+ start:609 stop:788 length:180 start_codon:yes stop_codon:yes gene_type:complete